MTTVNEFKSKRTKKQTYDTLNDNLSVDELIKKNIWGPLRTIKTDYFKKYVTGTDVKNFLLGDPILDWFNIYLDKKNIFVDNSKYTNNIKKSTNDEFLLFKNGNLFEKQIFDKLKIIYKENFVLISDSGISGFNEVNYLRTIEEMKKGTAIIAQGVLFNDANGTGGIADLIVRSDYINKLTKNPALYPDEINIKAGKLNGNYHYRIIDIKWSTFSLCADSCSIRNEGRVPSYKGQLAIYNVALGEIQGYFPDFTYILAKHWKLDNKNCDSPVLLNWDDLFGIVNYKKFDNKYIEKTKDAITWLNKLKSEGDKWDLFNPIVPEMYPNMANKNDSPWTEIKCDISKKIGELTQVWYVGVQNRIFAHEKNVLKWSDPKCTSETLNIKGGVRPIIIDKILEINRSETEVILPKKILNNMQNWKTNQNFDFYVDFETISNALYEEVNINIDMPNNEIIFMIGIGYLLNNEWIHKVFTCEKLSLEEENRIITEFFNYIYEIADNDSHRARIFHWHNAEVSNMERAEIRHNNKWVSYENSIIWIDMCKVFTEEPIVVNGAFNFKLKDIANALHKNGLIEIKWPESGPHNGFDAMCHAVKYYNELKIDINMPRDILHSIEEYNYIDCKSVWKIVKYLRENNC